MPTVEEVDALQHEIIISRSQFTEAAIPNDLYEELRRREEFLPPRDQLQQTYQSAYNSIQMVALPINIFTFFRSSGYEMPSDAAVANARNVVDWGNQLAESCKTMMGQDEAERIELERQEFAAKVGAMGPIKNIADYSREQVGEELKKRAGELGKLLPPPWSFVYAHPWIIIVGIVALVAILAFFTAFGRALAGGIVG